jgi:hypothetical protein
MQLRLLTSSGTIDSRWLRALVVILFIGLTFLKPGFCPTGHTACEMDGMAASLPMGGICLLACDVPMQANYISAPMFIGMVSFIVQPVVAEHFGGHVEPDLPPPRSLM